MVDEKISEYIKSENGASIPELQKKFGLSYREARAIVGELTENGRLSLSEGLRYDFVPPEEEKEEKEDFREILGRLHSCSDDEEEDGDDDDDDDDGPADREFRRLSAGLAKFRQLERARDAFGLAARSAISLKSGGDEILLTLDDERQFRLFYFDDTLCISDDGKTLEDTEYDVDEVNGIIGEYENLCFNDGEVVAVVTEETAVLQTFETLLIALYRIQNL